MRKESFTRGMLFLLTLPLLCVVPTFAQSSNESGKLKIHVNPKQAYVFVDGKAIRDSSQTINLAAGNHSLGVFNYGFVPRTQAVQINAGQTTKLDVSLQSSGDKVDGPFADLEFKGDPRAAVLLNGTTPAYFVGHVDEFNWDWIWHQRLLVHPGTYHITVTHEGNAIWSGDVTAKAGQKVIINLNKNGEMTTKNWRIGKTLPPQPRFHAGIASATVPIAPVTSQLTAQSTNLSCGQGTTLNWNSSNAVDRSISGIGEVANSGDRSVTPSRDTTYVLTAKGPGGHSTESVVLHVNAEPTATLALSEPQIRYRKVGDRVMEQGSATLNWSTSNAKSVKIEPLESDKMSGSRTITADPKQTSTGPVNENLTYTLTATNVCGGKVTKTATLHVVGSIDPPPSATLASVFFPTNYPMSGHPKAGLVAAEKIVLDNVATQFKNFGLYEHKAGLVVVGFADIRGSQQFNKALSERRAELIRDYLISKGIPANELSIRAEGKEKQLDQKTIKAQMSKADAKPAAWMTKNEKTTWLAYNRRADLVLEPTGQKSALMYPNDSTESRIVWQRKEPPLKKVEQASTQSTSALQATLGQPGN